MDRIDDDNTAEDQNQECPKRVESVNEDLKNLSDQNQVDDEIENTLGYFLRSPKCNVMRAICPKNEITFC